jgi:hypothetical protein
LRKSRFPSACKSAGNLDSKAARLTRDRVGIDPSPGGLSSRAHFIPITCILPYCMGVALKIGRYSFMTKTAAKKYVQEQILHAYPVGVPLNREHENFMRELLDRHRNATDKIGVGIEKIWVEQHPIFKRNRCFWLERIDGSKTDFSYIECITPPPAKRDFAAACRAAVADQIIEFRDRFFADNGGQAVKVGVDDDTGLRVWCWIYVYGIDGDTLLGRMVNHGPIPYGAHMRVERSEPVALWTLTAKAENEIREGLALLDCAG